MKVIINKYGQVIYTAIIILLVLTVYVSIIINANYSSTIPFIKKINKLKASVCAYSGLSLIQAFAAEYDDHDIHTEISFLEKKLDDSGTILISSWYDAGWLRVRSTGVHLKDTVCLEGALGQSPPEFTDNVLNIFDIKSNLVIADRTEVYGNVGTDGKGIVTKGSGLFYGEKSCIENAKYDFKSFEDEFQHVYNVFKERNKYDFFPDSMLPVKTDRFREIVAPKKGDIFIEDNLHLNEDFDFSEKTLWIEGDLFIKHNAKIKNIKANVKGDVFISGNTHIEYGSILCFGDVKVVDRACIRLNISCAETLLISEDACVYYPSVLFLSAFLEGKKGSEESLLLISDNAHIIGTVLTDDFEKSEINPRVYISGRAKIEGVLFSPAAITLNGRIYGSASVNKLIYQQPGCVYDGWLMEATLRECDLSEMVLPLVFPEKCKPRYLSIEKHNKVETL